MKTIALLLIALAAASAAPASPRLRGGAATSNITPPLGTLRVGGFAPYPTAHVHDELHARCLVLDDGRVREDARRPRRNGVRTEARCKTRGDADQVNILGASPEAFAKT